MIIVQLSIYAHKILKFLSSQPSTEVLFVPQMEKKITPTHIRRSHQQHPFPIKNLLFPFLPFAIPS